MSRSLDIGVLSYGSATQLQRAVNLIRENSVLDWTLMIMDNPGPDPETRYAIEHLADEDPRIDFKFLEKNKGYAAGVNALLQWACSKPSPDEPNLRPPYFAYVENDALIYTHGWDQKLAAVLDAVPDVGMVFPNGGAWMMNSGPCHEILWGVGFCWMTRRQVVAHVGYFDENLGHQEEVDWQLRVRLAGFRIAAEPAVHVSHAATSTRDPQAAERINRGIVRFVTKWEKYFGGEAQSYHSANVLRHELWPTSALYLERYFKHHVPDLNSTPEHITIEGREYDLIRVPRMREYYRGRII